MPETKQSGPLKGSNRKPPREPFTSILPEAADHGQQNAGHKLQRYELVHREHGIEPVDIEHLGSV